MVLDAGTAIKHCRSYRPPPPGGMRMVDILGEAAWATSFLPKPAPAPGCSVVLRDRTGGGRLGECCLGSAPDEVPDTQESKTVRKGWWQRGRVQGSLALEIEGCCYKMECPRMRSRKAIH